MTAGWVRPRPIGLGRRDCGTSGKRLGLAKGVGARADDRRLRGRRGGGWPDLGRPHLVTASGKGTRDGVTSVEWLGLAEGVGRGWTIDDSRMGVLSRVPIVVDLVMDDPATDSSEAALKEATSTLDGDTGWADPRGRSGDELEPRCKARVCGTAVASSRVWNRVRSTPGQQHGEEGSALINGGVKGVGILFNSEVRRNDSRVPARAIAPGRTARPGRRESCAAVALEEACARPAAPLLATSPHVPSRSGSEHERAARERSTHGQPRGEEDPALIPGVVKRIRPSSPAW